MSQTATADHVINTQEPVQEEAATKGEVAVISQPRLPYHPLLQERFGIDRAGWRALTDAVYPAAKTTDAVVLALSYCKARNLDPFKRVVHIVPVWNSDKGGYDETVWPGIAEHRTTAFRTKQYGGSDAAQFGPIIEMDFEGSTKRGKVTAHVKFPEWCQLTVYRLLEGQRVPIPGPRVYWLETYSRMGRTDVPNDRWQRAPFQMIEKCAEAAALRRAFPEELGDEPTADEAAALHRGPDNALDVTPPPAPTRAGVAAAASADLAKPAEPEVTYELVDETGVVEVVCKSADQFGEELLARGAPTPDGKFTDKALAYLDNNAEAAAAIANDMSDAVWKKVQALYNQKPNTGAATADKTEGATSEAPAKPAAEPPKAIPLPKKDDGRIEIAKYVALVNDAINKAASAAEVDAIYQVNAENIAKIPNGPQNSIKLRVGQRKAEIEKAKG